MATEESRRVRLLFKDKETILNQPQKSQGFKRSWVLLKPQHQTIADLSAYILNSFELHPSCPQGLILSVDGFVLPPFESTGILKDKDIISVKKNPLIPCLEGRNAGNVAEELQVMDRQPVNNGPLLLANEEFEKEAGGYQSDEPDDEPEDEPEEEDKEEEEQVEASFHPEKSSGVATTSKKRKAPEKLHGTQKKKQHIQVQESIQNDVSENQVGSSHHETPDKQRNLSNVKKKKDSGGDSDKKNAELNDTVMDTPPNLKETDQIENGDKSLEASEGTRKGPSRSARRKKAKRRWIREMAKIQKQADVSQPKGHESWKQKSAPARVGKKKHNNWKQKPAQVYSSKEDCGEPKGLLHWKSWSEKDKSDDKKENKDADQNGSTNKQPNHNTTEGELVPVVIRPGHIRFEPLEGDQVQRQSQVSEEPLQWNGITSKRRGQKWGTEKSSHSQKNGNKDIVGVHSHTLSTSKETNMNHQIDFDKLPSLSTFPKEGYVIGYRILELSSGWTPELSSYRVGQVSSCKPESGQVLLTPVAEHPIILEKPDEAISDQQPDNSLYKEDGSLEIDFSTLVDVRIVKDGTGGPREAETDRPNSDPAPTENTNLLETPISKDKQTQALTTENGQRNHSEQENATGTENGSDLWEQISEALSAKKAQLSQESSWGKPKPVTATWSYRALKGSAMGPTMAFLRSKNKPRKG